MEEEKKDIQQPEKKKKSLVKRIFKVFVGIILAIILLNILLYILLSIPAVQQKVKDFAVTELRKTLRTELSIEELRLSLFNNVTLKGVYIEDQSQDTLVYASNLAANLDVWQLLHGELLVTGIDLDDFVINVNSKDSISDYNFQFIIDAFAGTDSTAQDTTSSGGLQIVIKDINVKNGRLNYDILSMPQTPHTFNASHISIRDFEANIDLNSIDPDKFDISLNNLKATEQSGLKITSLKGHFYSLGNQLWVDDIELRLPNSHLITDKARYNLASSEFEISTKDTEIVPDDVKSFLPNLKFLTNKLTLNTQISGTLPSIDIENIDITYGDDAQLSGKASMSNCMRYAISDIMVDINKLKLSPTAITSFARLGDSTFTSPDILRQLGNINMKATLSGKLNKLTLTAGAAMNGGSLSLAARASTDSTFTNVTADANLKTSGFNLAAILGKEMGLGALAMNINVKARQSEHSPLSVDVDGDVNSIEYNSEKFRNIPFSAFYNNLKMGLNIDADLPLGRIVANAEMTQTRIPDIHLDMKVDSLDIDRFYKNPAWKRPHLSFALNGDIKGTDIDEMMGKITIDDFVFRDSSFNYQPGLFALELGRNETDTSKFIHLSSSILTASIEGNYLFATLPDELTNLLHNYIPNVFQQTKKIKHNENDFRFELATKNLSELRQIFALPVDFIQPVNINGYINTKERRVDIEGSIPHLRYDDMNIRNTKLSIANQDSAFNIIASTSVEIEGGKYSLSVKMNGANNSIHAYVYADSDSAAMKIKGQLETMIQFTRMENKKDELITFLQIIPSSIQVDNINVDVLPSKILYRDSKTEIHNFGLAVNKKPYFGAEGTISSDKNDSLRIYFDHAQIADLLTPFNIENIKASVNGNILLTNLLQTPEIYTKDLAISDIIIFGDTLGTMSLESQWNNTIGGIQLDASLRNKDLLPASVSGIVYTTRDSLDLKVDMDRMPINWAQPFVSDMLNRLSGNLSSGLTINGKLSAPIVQGWVGLNNTSVGIDYTNVTYTISDTIQIQPNRIGFDNLRVTDSQNHTATVSANVTHNNFENLKYSLNMNLNNLLVLNTESRTDSLFYGKLYASGNVKIDGDDNNINIVARVNNGKNSNIRILVPQTSEATTYRSVVYINTPEQKTDSTSIGLPLLIKKDEPLPLKLDVTLNVTSDLDIGVVINPSTGDYMQIKGNGNIKFAYNMVTEEMSTIGQYTATGGSVKINLQHIKELEFAIREGSQLDLVGDPMKTRFNITAARRVRADLKTLDSYFASDEGASSRVPVDCILKISGDLNKMNIQYDIELPDATDDIKQKVAASIATDEQKVRQFAYLVAFGSFYSSAGSNTNVGDGLWTGLASSTISGGLNAIFSNILGDEWEVGTNIESNDGTLNDMDMTVNVSRKFLNDRLRFNTNLGYRNNNSSDNSFVGDFDVEYILNNMWTVKFYNKTNNRYYSQAETTQGIGIVYTREARSLKRLFRFWGGNRRTGRGQNNNDKEGSNNIKAMNKEAVKPTENKEQDQKEK